MSPDTFRDAGREDLGDINQQLSQMWPVQSRAHNLHLQSEQSPAPGGHLGIQLAELSPTASHQRSSLQGARVVGSHSETDWKALSIPADGTQA